MVGLDPMYESEIMTPHQSHFKQTVLGSLVLVACLGAGSSRADCTNQDVLGTSRTLLLKREAAAYGTAQHQALALAPKEVVISFDDGPRPESTPQVLAALKAQCVQATFFMNGEPLDQHLSLAQQVRAEGHSVGMHGYRHHFFDQLPPAEQLADLKAMQASYQKAFGVAAAAYRFPYLIETPTLMDALKAQQITVMSVDVGMDDWLPNQSPKILADRLIERMGQGGILLLHDVQDQTAQALPLLLQTLKAQGYKVVHLEWQ